MNYKRSLFTLISSLLYSTTLLADYYFDSQGVAYYYEPSGNTAALNNSGQHTSGVVVIPETVQINGKSYTVTRIYGYAFSGCTGLTSINIPNSVTSIGNYAFSGCTGLTSINIPNSVTSIGDGAFKNCTGLTSINIPNSVTNIKDNTFYGCTGLTSINIPNSVTSIGNEAFYGCMGLTSINIPKSVTNIGNYAFENCNALIKVNITDIESWLNIEFLNSESNPLVYAKHLYLGDEEITNLVIPNSVTSIRDYAFEDCTGLTSITIPNSVTSIGHDAFSRCTNLKSVVIPHSVTDIGIGAFWHVPLTSVIIPESVTKIDEGAFAYNPMLKSVKSLSKHPSAIHPEGFRIEYGRSSSLDEITTHINRCVILYVPRGCKERYMNTEGWKEFPHIFEINDADANMDNEINTADVMSVYTYIIEGGEGIDGVVYEDVNNDKEVNTADVASIYSYIINGEKSVLDLFDDEQCSNSLRIFKWVITADDKYVANPNSAPLNEFFSSYLSALGANFSLFIPTDNALKHYYDPISMGFSQPYMLAFNYDERNTSNPISAYAYKYDPNTHQTDDWRMTVTMRSSQINNRLKDMLNAHIIVHDEADEDGILSGKTFYTTKGGAPIKVTDPAKGINGGKVQGAWQIEHDEFCNIKEIFDQSRKTNGYGNGMTYIIDRPLQSTVHSVYKVLNDNGAEDSPYAKFFGLCQVDLDVIEEAGFVDDETLYPTREDKDLALSDFLIFTSSSPCMDYNVRFFTDHDYTVYVPTNSEMEKEIARGMPTWKSIKDFINNAKQEIKAKQQSISGYNAAEDIETYKTKAQAMCAMLLNLVKYHFQKSAVYNDTPATQSTTYESMCFNAEASSSVKLEVQNAGNGKLTVRDAALRKHNVDATRNNILTRDMEYDRVGISATTIETSSFAVLHQIDGVLRFAALPSGRYDGFYDTLEKARKFMERYPVK